MNRTMTAFTTLHAALVAISIGCDSNQTPSTPKADSSTQRHEHDHPSTGPHGGDLIELGNESYHAEIMHDGETTVYLLDGSAKEAAHIEAADVLINVTHDGKAEQFRLAAARQDQDPEGKVSRFSSNDAELLGDLTSGDAEVELVVSIEGKQYRGTLEHHHHEEEGHAP
jgi:hypothetical protein